jgi:hypothetical protein
MIIIIIIIINLDVMFELAKVSRQMVPTHGPVRGAESKGGKMSQVFVILHDRLHLHRLVARLLAVENKNR